MLWKRNRLSIRGSFLVTSYSHSEPVSVRGGTVAVRSLACAFAETFCQLEVADNSFPDMDRDGAVSPCSNGFYKTCKYSMVQEMGKAFWFKAFRTGM